jgi:hypothetical protein
MAVCTRVLSRVFIDNIILYGLSAAPIPFRPQRDLEEGHGPYSDVIGYPPEDAYNINEFV